VDDLRVSEVSPDALLHCAKSERHSLRSIRGRSATCSCHHPVLEVGDAGRLDGPDLLELHLRVSEVVEETSTVAEHHRNDVELKFVQQSR
jgi:hypothetical protein